MSDITTILTLHSCETARIGIRVSAFTGVSVRMSAPTQFETTSSSGCMESWYPLGKKFGFSAILVALVSRTCVAQRVVADCRSSRSLTSKQRDSIAFYFGNMARKYAKAWANSSGRALLLEIFDL